MKTGSYMRSAVYRPISDPESATGGNQPGLLLFFVHSWGFSKK